MTYRDAARDYDYCKWCWTHLRGDKVTEDQKAWFTFLKDMMAAQDEVTLDSGSDTDNNPAPVVHTTTTTTTTTTHGAPQDMDPKDMAAKITELQRRLNHMETLIAHVFAKFDTLGV